MPHLKIFSPTKENLL